MRLITLNIWGGKVHDPLFEFLKTNKDTTDIFCFQETFKSDRSTLTPNGSHSNILGELKNELTDFNYFMSPVYFNRDFENTVDYPLAQGPAIFWKKNLIPIKKGEVFVHYKQNEVRFFENNKPDSARCFQYIIFNNFLIANIHGYWAPSPKTDTPERIKQSQIILEFIEKYKIPKIICGDFNLAINTKSISMLEEKLHNLVRESGAETTRSTFYDIKWRENDKFADYIFTSNDLGVKGFEVMTEEVSDHLPLALEFNT